MKFYQHYAQQKKKATKYRQENYLYKILKY